MTGLCSSWEWGFWFTELRVSTGSQNGEESRVPHSFTPALLTRFNLLQLEPFAVPRLTSPAVAVRLIR
jgi:hypothetical protein